MNEPLEMETIMEVREDFMVSPAGDSEPTLRKAHFLKPLANTIYGSDVDMLAPVFEPKEWPLTIHFNGWRYPSEKWIGWVDTLHPKYESVWKKAGIFEAIMSTKCYVKKNQDLAFGVAEKWCSKTNTFIFPWGEAAITLEDVMVLGGYPVLGDPFFTPLESQEMEEIEEKLVLARKVPWKSKHGRASTSAWMDLFINSGSEIEHEAFLVTWLSMFVFPYNFLVRNAVFPVAIHLARGNPIALAPAVLASIYKDLGLLKTTIVDVTENALVGDKVQLEVTLQSPFYLVQVWVWERFKYLQPEPRLINNEDPILARWHKVNALKIDNVRLALDSAVEDFLWRPYVRYAGKCRLLYPENEIWVPLDTDVDDGLVSLFTFMRVCELVGLGSVIEQYLPNRVALQFGMDQDVPGYVPRYNASQSIAWENYCRPICDGYVYIPSRLFEADVTTRYTRWWKLSVLGHQDPVKNIVQRKRSARSSNHGPWASKANRSGNDADVPPGFPPKLVSTVISGKSSGDGSKTRKCDNDADVLTGFLPKRSKTVTSGNSVQDVLKANYNIDADVPTGFPPKHNTMNLCSSIENCKPDMEENKLDDMIHNLGKVPTHEGKHLFSQGFSASTADYGADIKILPLAKPVAKDNIKPSVEGLEGDFEDTNGSKESRLSQDRGCLSGTQGEVCSCASEINVLELEQRISRLERVITKLNIARFRHN